MKQEQIACIFCGKSVIKEKIDLSKYDNWDINWIVLQVREMLAGPGRGKKIKGKQYGFPAIPEEGLSIIQMSQIGEYEEIVEAIKHRLLKIVKAYVEHDIISKEEIAAIIP